MSRSPDDVRMTFGEHLEELRRHVLISLLAFAAAFVAAFVFQDRLMEFFAGPYERARVEENRKREEEWALTKHEQAPATRLVDELYAHLKAKGAIDAESAKRLDGIQAKELEEKAPLLERLQAIKTGEVFAAYMLICLLAALIVSAPILLYQLWRFVAAGLYEHEQKIVLRVMPFSLLLFASGFMFGYFVLAKISVQFLIGYGDPTLVDSRTAIGAYLGLLFMLLLVMGLVFQIPLVMTVLAAVGMVQPAFFRAKRRYFILAIFIVAAIITPPDYISQLLVAGPMLVLFEFGIWLASGAARRRSERNLAEKTDVETPKEPVAK